MQLAFYRAGRLETRPPCFRSCQMGRRAGILPISIEQYGRSPASKRETRYARHVTEGMKGTYHEAAPLRISGPVCRAIYHAGNLPQSDQHIGAQIGYSHDAL